MSRILILYLSDHSGHHSAAKALDAALHQLDPSVETLCVDPLRYTHPRLSALIHRTYMVIIRRTPEVWDALYDSKHLDTLTSRIRGLVQRGKSKPFLAMISRFQPDAVVCTQAYPFGVMQAYMENHRKNIPLWGVITDYKPHRFWIFKAPANYIVPCDSAAERLTGLGINPGNISPLGIPVDPSFLAIRQTDSAPRKEQVLVMGGNHGLGAGVRTLRMIDNSRQDFAIQVITGRNRLLRRRLMTRRTKFNHTLRIRGFVRVMANIMKNSSILVSKPGGLTSAEAMALGLPMIIAHALPGQEAGNADELVKHGAALRLDREKELTTVIDMLISNPELLSMMRERAACMGKPDAAFRIAENVLRSL